MTQTLPAGIDQRTAAAALWLHELFAETDGYVHVATSDPTAAEGPGWSPWRGIREAELGIPDDRPALLAGLAEKLVLESDLGVDVFACPYPLMGARVRAAGRATTRRHAHADIDGPVDLDAARALGAWAVASGSTAADGTAHGHVYVRMTESVPEHVHTALCRALGPMVGGEHHDRSKVNDNDVLRPPGTVNQKPGGGPVSWLIRADDPAVRTWNPEALARLLGAGWPIPEPGGEPEARPAAAVAPSALGGAARRVDGLVRGVREAEHGDGNNALNHAAYVCGALYATAGEAEGLDAAEVREHLVRAYQERPSREPASKREREARATVRSGWDSGAADPRRALADRRPQQSAEERLTMTTTEPGAAEYPEEPPTECESAEFWASREVLRAVRSYSRARRIGRWALLGAVLARAAAEVPPSVVLPPTRGTAASLNLYVGLCSESGGGKSAAMGTAAEVLDVRGGAGPLETSLGSGEGLLAAYVHVQKEKGQAPRVVQHRASVLFDVDEVGSLGALAARTNSTLLPFLKSAWSGRLLATQNADAERLRRVEAHAYRLAVVAGVQPKHAGTILDDDGGGFPQRWLWMPTYDAEMPSRAEEVSRPSPYRWQVPGVPVEVADDGTVTVQRSRPMELPAEAVAAILDAAEVANRPIGAPAVAGTSVLDGHALLSRAKVAALLALLDGRGQEIAADDWRLAGLIMRVSDHTRASVVSVRGAEASRDADRRAIRQGRSSFIAREAEEDTRAARVMSRLLDGIRDKGRERGGPVPLGEVRKLANSRDRDVVPEALERLTATGQVIAEEGTGGNGRPVTFYSPAVGR